MRRAIVPQLCRAVTASRYGRHGYGSSKVSLKHQRAYERAKILETIFIHKTEVQLNFTFGAA